MEIKKIFEIKIEIHPDYRRHCSYLCEHLHYKQGVATCDLTTVNGLNTILEMDNIILNLNEMPKTKYGVKITSQLIAKRTFSCIDCFGEGRND